MSAAVVFVNATARVALSISTLLTALFSSSVTTPPEFAISSDVPVMTPV